MSISDIRLWLDPVHLRPEEIRDRLHNLAGKTEPAEIDESKYLPRPHVGLKNILVADCAKRTGMVPEHQPFIESVTFPATAVLRQESHSFYDRTVRNAARFPPTIPFILGRRLKSTAIDGRDRDVFANNCFGAQ